MSVKVDLKPCPFCGEEARVDGKYLNLGGESILEYFIVCSVCGASSDRRGVLHDDHKAAVERAAECWNKRV